MKTKEEIIKRIEEIKEIKKTVSGNGSRSKYSFVIGELEWVIGDEYCS